MFTQNPQTAGVETISGTYIFDLRTSNRTIRFNHFFWSFVRPERRDAFLKDEEAAMTTAELSEHEKELVRARDWLGIVQYGVNFFALEKMARVLKKSNLEVYATMRGEDLETFMLTRNVPTAR